MTILKFLATSRVTWAATVSTIIATLSLFWPGSPVLSQTILAIGVVVTTTAGILDILDTTHVK